MKKALITLLAVTTVFAGLLSMYGYKENVPKKRVAHKNLYASQYVDYAKEVDWDYELYPDHAEMGLFWTYWDEENKSRQVAADSQRVPQLIDPDKPTIINVLQLGDGHRSKKSTT